MATMKQAERAEAADRLREWLAPGDTVYTILRHRSSSGMLRVIELVKLDCKAERVLALGYNAATAMGDRYDRDRDGIRVSGAGMDMGFHLVYGLGRTLWPDGFDCVGERCNSNDHSNGMPRNLPAGKGAPFRHSDGGYALDHRWL